MVRSKPNLSEAADIDIRALFHQPLSYDYATLSASHEPLCCLTLHLQLLDLRRRLRVYLLVGLTNLVTSPE